MAWIVLNAVIAAMQMVVILPRVTVAVYQDGQVQKRLVQSMMKVSSMMVFNPGFLWVEEEYVGLEEEGASSVAVVSLPVIHRHGHGNFIGCGFHRKLETEGKILQLGHLHNMTPHEIWEQL